MSGRLAQYKKAGGTVKSKKASVREEKIRETKSKRNDRFMSGRPLCDEVDIQSKKLDKEKIKSKTVCTRRMDRKEELLKWKEKRQTEIAEEKAANKKQRPPFVVGKFKLGEDKLELQTIEKHSKKGKKRSLKRAKKTPLKVKRQNTKSINTRSQKNVSPNMSPAIKDADISCKSPPGNSSTKVQISRDEVNQSAWVVDAVLSTPKIATNFDETFTKNFSPFVFTANVSEETYVVKPLDLSLKESENVRDDCSYLDTSVGNKVSRSDDSIEVINHSIFHNHEMSNAINDNEHDVGADGTAEPESGTNNEASELVSFRQLYDDIMERFTGLCEEWEQKEVDLQESEQINQEVCDQIRITACQARLLMRSKLKQYIGLVDKAEDPSQPRPTTTEDLQGFWDMMYLQISDIETKFKNLSVMEENNWEENIVKEKKKSKIKKLRKKRASFGKKRTPSGKQKADREKRAEQRQLLRQKIMSAKKKKQRCSISKSPCLTDSPAAGSGLTPPVMSSKQPQSNSPIPVGNLISLTPCKNTPFKSVEKKSLSLLKNAFQSSSSDSDGGSITKLVRLNSSKRLIKELGSDFIMSPVRRSLRIHRKSVGVVDKSNDLMTELPDDVEYVMYKANKSIIDTEESQ